MKLYTFHRLLSGNLLFNNCIAIQYKEIALASGSVCFLESELLELSDNFLIRTYNKNGTYKTNRVVKSGKTFLKTFNK